MRLGAARRDAPGGRETRAGPALLALLFLLLALPALADARRAEPVELSFWPAGQGTVEARTESGVALGRCRWDDASVFRGGNACSVTVEPGTRVRLVATGAAGSPFLHWDRFTCPGTEPCTVVAAADGDVVVATFRRQHLEVGVLPEVGPGTVSWRDSVACPPTCDAWLDAGDEVVLAARGGAHAWGRGCVPEGGDPAAPRCSLTMSNLRVFARVGFGTEPEQNFPFDLRVRLRVQTRGGGSGRVTGSGRDPDGTAWRIDCGSACTADNLDLQTIVTLHAERATGSRFAGWLGVCAKQDVCRFAAGSRKVVGAVFEPASPSSPQPATFAVGVPRVTVVGRKAIVARIVLDRGAAATLRLLRGSSVVAARTVPLAAGRTDVRLALPRGLAPGWYRLRGRFVDAAGAVALLDRPVRLRG